LEQAKHLERTGTTRCRIAIMRCKACFHHSRTQIDEQIVAGVPLRSVSASFNLSLGSLHRHKSHIRQALSEAIVLRDGEGTERGSALLSRIEEVISEAKSIAAMAKAEKSFAAATGALGTITKCLELLGKLSGALQQGGSGIHLTQHLTQVNVVNHGDDHELAMLVSEATKHFNSDELQRLKALAECTTVATPLLTR
jgi:hypothetical protein